MFDIRSSLVVSTALLLGAGMASISIAHAQPATQNYQIPAGDLGTALTSFAAKSRLQIIYPPVLVVGKRTSGLSGSYAPQQALVQLLQGTGLRADAINANTFVLKPTPRPGVRETPSPAASAGSRPPPKPTELAAVQVTGTRLLETTNEGPLPVNVYTRKQIEQSGQTTIGGFLNTLPEVSTSFTEAALQAASQNQGYSGNTTVQLRGLPSGATAVLLDGHRLETTGTTNNTFNLNLIPLAAIDRIEIVPQGSSAIYGSDALAGVVNIILKKNFDGTQFDATYGGASDTDEKTGSIAWGKTWQHGHVSVVGTYYKRDALLGEDRDITANQDYTRFGGPDARVTQCNPGNVYSADGSNLPGLSSPQAAIPAGLTGTASIADFGATAGHLNKCSNRAFADQLPPTERLGGLLTGSYQLIGSTELFTEVIYSKVHQHYHQGRRTLSRGLLSASNPFNPFGENIFVDYRFDEPRASYGLDERSAFWQALIGIRGDIGNSWDWELSAWQSKDRAEVAYYNGTTNFLNIYASLSSSDPTTAFNPFVADPVDTTLLQTFFSTPHYTLTGQTRNANILLRGPLFDLPAGSVQAAFGADYRQDGFFQSSDLARFTATNNSTDSRAVYGEFRVPLIASGTGVKKRDILSLTAAVRYDSYSTFGGEFTPQGGIEWRPTSGLLVRGSYSKAYKAPSAFQTSLPAITLQYPAGYLFDPRRGGETATPTVTIGGNPALVPETGRSYSVGAVWDSEAVRGFHAAFTRWVVALENNVTLLPLQTVIDNEDFFPSRVVRGPSQDGEAGPLIFVDDSYLNFGRLNTAGVDYEARYRFSTRTGTWEASLRATETMKYEAELIPSAPVTERVSRATDTGWAPRWKGSLGLAWSRNAYSAALTGRYVSRYRDYDGARDLGNFWLFDANARMDVGQAIADAGSFWSGSYVSVGVVNLFDSLPKFSNFRAGFAGYDPSQYDIRGRFVYMKVGIQW